MPEQDTSEAAASDRPTEGSSNEPGNGAKVARARGGSTAGFETRSSKVDTVRYDRALDEEGRLSLDGFRRLEAELSKAGRFEDLAGLYELGAERAPDPDTGRAMMLSAGLLFLEKLGRTDRAEVQLRRVLASEPAHVEALDALHRLCVAKGRFDEAADFLELAVGSAADIDKPDFCLDLAKICHERLAQPARAVAALRFAFQVDGSRLDVLERARAILTADGRYRDAFEVLMLEVSRLEALGPLGPEETRSLAESFRAIGVQLSETPIDLDLAEHALSRARQLGDNDALARLDELAHLRQNWLSEVTTLRDEALASRDKRRAATLYVRAAELLLALGKDPVKAEDFLKKAFILVPGFLEGVRFLERWYRSPDRFPELAKKLVAAGEDVRDRREKVDILLRAARKVSEIQDSEAALARYLDVLATAPENKEAAHAASALLEAAGRHNEEAEVLEAFVASAEEEHLVLGARAQLGTVYEQFLGQTQEARACFEEILRKRSNDFVAASALRALYSDSGDTAGLVRVLRILVEYSPDLESRLEMLAELARAAGEENKEAAFDATRQIFELNPTDTGLRANLERLGEELGRLDTLAHVYARAAARVSGERAFEMWSLAGRIFDEKLSRSEQAADCYKRALELKPSELSIRDALERLLRERDDPRALVDMLESQLARAESPKDKAVLYGKLGSALDRDLVEPIRAAESYQKVLELEPENTMALEALDDLYRRLARPSELLGILKRREALVSGARERAVLRARQAQLLCGPMGQAEQGAEIYLDVLPSVLDEPWVLDAMAELAERGVRSAALAGALEPVFGQRGQADRQVQMLHILLAGEPQAERKAELARKAARVLETRLGAPDRALEAYAVALSAQPADGEALASLLRVATETGGETQAATVLEDVLTSRELGAETQSALATALAHLFAERLDRTQEAIDWYMQAMRADPKNAAAVTALERLLGSGERWGEMATFLEERLAAVEEPAGRVLLGVRLAIIREERLHDEEGAMAALAAVLAVEPNDRAALERRADLLEKRGAGDELLDALDRLKRVSSDPEVQAALELRAGDALRLRIKDPKGALVRYRRVLELRPGDEQAVRALEALLEETSLRPEVAQALESVYEATGRHRELVVALESQRPLATTSEAKRALELRIAQIQQTSLGQPELAFATLATAFRASLLTREDEAELVRIGLQANAGEDLAQLLEEASRARPGDVELLRTLARLYDGAVANHAKAVEAWTRLGEAQPGDEEALSALERLHGAGDDPNALAVVLLERATAAPDDETKVAFLKRAAAIYEEMVEDLSKAALVLEQACQIAPRDRNTLQELQRLYRELGRKDRVAELVAAEVEVTEEPSQRVEVLTRLAEACRERADLQGTTLAYQQILAIDREQAKAREGLEALLDSPVAQAAAMALEPAYRASADWSKLVVVYEKLADVSEDAAERAERLNAIRSIYEDRLDDNTRAFRAATRAFRDAPADEEVFQAVLRLAQATGNLEELEAMLQDAIERNAVGSEARHVARTRHAMFLESQPGDHTTAFLAWRGVVEDRPHDLRALEALVRVGLEVGDLPNAVWALETQAEILPEPAMKIERLKRAGQVLERVEDGATQSVQVYERILSLDPADADALARLDKLYTKLGRHADLERILAQSVARSAPSGERSIMVLRLGRLRLARLGLVEKGIDTLAEIVRSRGDGSEAALEGAVSTLDEFIEHKADDEPLQAARAGALLEPYFAERGESLKVVRAKGVRVAAVESPEDRRRIRFEIAEVYEKQLQDPAMAFLTLQKSFREAPGDAEITSTLERLAAESEIQEELADLYNEVIPSVSDEALRLSLLRRIAVIYRDELNRPEQAAKFVERVQKLSPGDAEVLAELERLYRKLDDKRGLVSVLRRKLEQLQLGGADRQAVSKEMAQLLESEIGDVDATIEAFRAMLALNPDDMSALEGLSEVAFRENRSPELIFALTELAARTEGAKKADYLVQLGEAQVGTANPLAGVEAFRAALEVQPQHPGAVAQLGLLLRDEGPAQLAAASVLAPLYGRTGAFNEQINCLDILLRGEEDSGARKRLLLEIADIFDGKLGRIEQAFRCLQQALREDLEDDAVRAQVERLARANDLFEELAGFYLDEIDRSSEPRQIQSLRKRAADVFHHQLGDNERAINEYSKVLDASPGDLEALQALEALYKASGAFAQLGEVYRRRIAQAEDRETRVLLMRELARVQADQLGDGAGAIATLRRLLDLEPGDTAAMSRLAELSEAAGRTAELEEILARLIETESAAGRQPIEAQARLARLKLEQAGDRAGGLRLATEVLGLDPSRVELIGTLQETLAEALAEEDARGVLETSLVLAPALRQAEDWQGLIEVLRARASVTPDPDARRALNEEIASTYLDRLSQPELGFGAMVSVFQDAPGDRALSLRLEALAEKLGLLEELTEAFDDAARDAVDDEVVVAIRTRIAEIFDRKLEQKDRAVEAWQAVLERRPMDVQALEALDRLHTASGRFGALVDVLEKRVELAADEPELAFGLLLRLGGVWEQHLEEREESAAVYRRARALRPGDDTVLKALGRVLDESTEGEELYSVLEELVRGQKDPKVLLQTIPRMARLALSVFDQRARSIELWEWVLANDKGNEEAANALESLYEEEGAWQKLAEHLARRIEATRDDRELTRLQRKLGTVKGRWLGNVDEAIASWTDLLRRNPTDVEALRSLRDIYRVGGRHEELAQTLRKLIPLQTDATGVKEIRFELAEVYLRNLGRREEAIEAAKRVLDVEPHEVAELVRLEQIFVEAGAYNDAIRVMNQRADETEDPGAKADVLFAIAEIYESKLSRRAGAATAYEKILEAEPSNVKAYDALSAIYEVSGEFRKLVELRGQRLPFIEETEERRKLLFEIISLQEKRLGHKDLAFSAACRAFAEEGADPEAQAIAERLAEETESWEILAEVYLEQLDAVPTERAIELRLRLAELYAGVIGEPDEAVRHLDYVLSVRPGAAGTHPELARLLEAQGRYEELVRSYEKHIEAADESSERKALYFRIAQIQEKELESPQTAVSTLRRALGEEPSDREVLRALSDLLRRVESWMPLVDVLERQKELAEAASEQAEIAFDIARIFEGPMGDEDRAIDAYRAVLRVDSGHLPAMKALEALYASNERWADLVSVLEQEVSVLGAVPEVIPLLMTVATVQEDHFQDHAAAEDALRRVLAIDGLQVPAFEALEQVLLRLERWKDLVAVFRSHLAISKNLEERIDLLLRLGAVHEEKLREVEEARARYEEALDVDPSSTRALRALGALHEREGNWFNALDLMRREAGLLGPVRAAVDLHFRTGRIQEEMLMDVGAAKSAYKEALAIDGGHAPSLHALQALAHSEENWPEIVRLEAQEAAHTKDYEAKAALYQRAAENALEHLEDEALGIELFEHSLEAVHDHLPSVSALADLYFATEQWEKSERLLEILVQRLDPELDRADLCRQYYRLAYISEKLEADERALQRYLSSYEADPGYLPTLEGLGAALLRAERWQDAQEIYRAILEGHNEELTDAEVVDLHFQLGELGVKLEDLERARRHFARALELDRHHPGTLQSFARLQERLGMYEEAYDLRARLVDLLGGSDRFEELMLQAKLSRGPLRDPYRAIDAYAQARKLEPSNEGVLVALGGLYKETSQHARAVDALTALAKVIEDPTKQRDTYLELAALHYGQEPKAWKEAVQALNAALDVDPACVAAFQHIEQILAEHGAWAVLEENYRKMIERLPKTASLKARAVLWKSLGDLYRVKLQNRDGAITAYRVVLDKLDPEDESTSLALAELLSRRRETVADALRIYHQLVATTQDPANPVRSLDALYRALEFWDRALSTLGALVLMRSANEVEQKLYEKFLSKAPKQASRKLDDKLWRNHLFHPDCRNSLADIFSVVYRAAPELFSEPRRALLLKKKERVDLKSRWGRAGLRFFEEYRYIASVLNLPELEHYHRAETDNPPVVLPGEPAVLFVGAGNAVFRDVSSREIRWMLGRELLCARPEMAVVRALPTSDDIKALLEAVVRLYVPEGSGLAQGTDPRAVEAWMRELSGALSERAVKALRGPVATCVERGDLRRIGSYLAGIEHTASRLGLLLAGDVRVAERGLADKPIVDVKARTRARELLLFLLSEDYFVLRESLELALTQP